MAHIDETVANELVDNRLDTATAARVRGHLAECAVCNARVERLSSLRSRLRSLTVEGVSTHDLWPAIRTRMEMNPQRYATSQRTPRRVIFRRAGQIAAMIATLMIGFAAGAMRRSSDHAPAAPPATISEAAATVQEAGTRYVAALATLQRMNAQSRNTSDRAMVNQGREAGLASLYAASRQIALIAPDDRDAFDIVRTVSASLVKPNRSVHF